MTMALWYGEKRTCSDNRQKYKVLLKCGEFDMSHAAFTRPVKFLPDHISLWCSLNRTGFRATSFPPRSSHLPTGNWRNPISTSPAFQELTTQLINSLKIAKNRKLILASYAVISNTERSRVHFIQFPPIGTSLKLKYNITTRILTLLQSRYKILAEGYFWAIDFISCNEKWSKEWKVLGGQESWLHFVNR